MDRCSQNSNEKERKVIWCWNKHVHGVWRSADRPQLNPHPVHSVCTDLESSSYRGDQPLNKSVHAIERKKMKRKKENYFWLEEQADAYLMIPADIRSCDSGLLMNARPTFAPFLALFWSPKSWGRWCWTGSIQWLCLNFFLLKTAAAACWCWKQHWWELRNSTKNSEVVGRKKKKHALNEA